MGNGSVVGGRQLVAEFPYRLGRVPFKRTDDGTELLNINGASTGTALNVWNGTGASDTGGDWTRTGQGSESSSADAGSGTNGLDSGTVGANTYANFDNGTEIDVAGTYSTLEFMLQPKTFPGNGKLRIQWRNAATTVVSSTLDIENYVTNMDIDIWQKVTIPIADFNLTGDVQSLRILFAVGNQRHYFDDIELIQSGGLGPKIFRVAAPDNTQRFHLSMAVLLMAAPETGWNSDAFCDISGGLTNGIIFRHYKISTSEVITQFNTKNNIELFGQYHPQEHFLFADSNRLAGFMVKPGRATLIITDDEVLDIVVRDNLSTIDAMRAYCHYGVEEV